MSESCVWLVVLKYASVDRGGNSFFFFLLPFFARKGKIKERMKQKCVFVFFCFFSPLPSTPLPCPALLFPWPLFLPPARVVFIFSRSFVLLLLLLLLLLVLLLVLVIIIILLLTHGDPHSESVIGDDGEHKSWPPERNEKGGDEYDDRETDDEIEMEPVDPLEQRLGIYIGVGADAVDLDADIGSRRRRYGLHFFLLLLLLLLLGGLFDFAAAAAAAAALLLGLELCLELLGIR